MTGISFQLTASFYAVIAKNKYHFIFLPKGSIKNGKKGGRNKSRKVGGTSQGRREEQVNEGGRNKAREEDETSQGMR